MKQTAHYWQCVGNEKIIDKANRQCLLCPKKYSKISDRYQHIRDKHHIKIKMIRACKLQFEDVKKYAHHQEEKQKHFIDTQGVIICLASDELARVHLDPYPLLS